MYGGKSDQACQSIDSIRFDSISCTEHVLHRAEKHVADCKSCFYARSRIWVVLFCTV